MAHDKQMEIHLSDEDVLSTEPHVFTVSELNSQIRQILEGEFPTLWIKAEISNFKPHSSGHYYFSLKDESSQISAVMFKGYNARLKFRPENGMEVLVRGKVTVYEPRGGYQIFCESMEPVGAGALQKAFEQLKAKLQAEGLFESDRKRPLPAFPKHIGIVTSPTGAAIRDILNVLRRRCKWAQITLSPAVVQGEPAPASIVSAIELINKLSDVDVLIVGRGGGSIEDLWAFNDERVARAIAASRIPVVSAVGHEVDFTIADFVADLRAPTPSAAAELVVKNAGDLTDKLNQLRQSLWRCWQFKIQHVREKWLGLSKRLVDPQRKLQDLVLRSDELATRLEGAMYRFLEHRRAHVLLARGKMVSPKELLERLSKKFQLLAEKMNNTIRRNLDLQKSQLANAAGRLDAMSPLRVVQRGYSIVQKGSQIVKNVSQLKVGEKLDVQFAKGRATVSVEKLNKENE